MLKKPLKRMVQSMGRNLFDVYCDPVNAMRLEALNETVDYIKANARDALSLRTREKLLDVALDRMDVNGFIMEFGVHKGKTLRHIAERVAPRQVYGFDSFRGNPEDWAGWNAPRGVFDLRGQMPKVPANVELVEGYFDDSLPVWSASQAGDIAFVHIDCDLYSSTKAIFENLGGRFVPGSVIVFDEYFNYTNWQQHEYRAFQEYIADSGRTYRYLAYSTQQVAVILG
jgi:hypothetical protein